jgi:hypothetical protein
MWLSLSRIITKFKTMKKLAQFLTVIVFLVSISAFSQKKLNYAPKLIDNPEEVLEEVIQNDPKLGKKVGEVHITKFRLSITKTSFAFQSATSYKKVTVQSVLLKDITKLQIIHENKELYILEVYDSRRSKKQFIIYSHNLENCQRACDALYTLQQRAQATDTKQ